MEKGRTVVLLVDESVDFCQRVERMLHEDEQQTFKVIWKNSGDEAIREARSNPTVDVILMEYFLSGKNGFEITRSLHDQRIRKPIIMLTVNKDFDIAVEVMKLGVAEYLVKDEISGSVLARTISKVLEKQKLQAELMALEITKHRLEAMRDLVSRILGEIEQPAAGMDRVLKTWVARAEAKRYEKFLKIIQENVVRINTKIGQLRRLNTDKTVQYIKDIRMIDLS